MFRMKLKILTGIIAAGCLFANLAFGRALQITGEVKADTRAQITLLCDGQTWTIRRAASTTPHSTQTVGDTVTVRCKFTKRA